MGGVVGEPLAGGEADAMIFDPANDNLIGYANLVGDRVTYTFFDAADQQLWKAVVAAFPGQGTSLVSSSNDRQRIIVRVDSPTEGPAYALVDRATRHAHWLYGEYAGVKPADISPVQTLTFKAADGIALTGYLTSPRDRPQKKLQLIVLPHGGPAVRDAPGFDWWAQALASRGYAVLQINYRGSDGFGPAFMKAGFGQWGRKMQTDLSDGVRYLTQRGVVDPKRVCIVGASYGGYAALAGATIDHGVYRCAASYGGVSDLKRQVLYSRTQGGQRSLRFWIRYMGADDLNDPVLAKYSPALLAAQADIPILLVHGKDDTVVPLQQSTGMADALKAAGKPYEFVVLKGEDHWLSSGETRLAMLQAVTAFLEKHNPPD